MDTGPARLGQWLDITLTNRGIKNRDLAKKLKVHESAVHNWRKGKNVPQLSTLQALAKLLDADPIRLAVTAGLFDVTVAEPLPMPEPTAMRAKARNRANELLEELSELTASIRGGDHEVDAQTLEALTKIRELIGSEGP